MATTLDSLFNSPTPSPSQPKRIATPQSSPAGPSERADPSNPLFFSPSPSPSQAARRVVQNKRPRSSVLDYEDELPDLPPPLPPAGQRREQTYDDPMAGLMMAGGRIGGEGNGIDADGEKTVKRRVIAKVDADRLMGERGFPALMAIAKKFRSGGKGKEHADLRNLLGTYQMWAHGMFPKGDFKHTLVRVETVCRTRRMENAMKGYRDAFYPRARSPTTPLSPPPQEASRSPSPSAPPSVPARLGTPGTPREVPLFLPDDGDLEEMMALEEMEKEERAKAAPINRAESEPPVLEEEDEWEGLYD
ncbi:replication fork protection complex subunit TIPIN/Csm3/Swi3, partial [Tremellales sp. Uapishka_1]